MTGSDSEKPRASRGCGLPWAIAGVAVLLLLLLALLPPSTPRPRPHAQCMNSLKLIGLALHNYHDEHGALPPAVMRGPDGTPWHSWRVLLLPYLDQPGLFKEYRFDEPWNGPHNRTLAEKMQWPYVFQCPADRNATRESTNYLAVVGDRTLWPEGRSLTFGDVPDGISETILVVEVADSGIHWMEPRDLEFDAMEFSINAQDGPGIRGHHPGEERWGPDGPPRAFVLMGDGSIRALDTETAPESIQSMLLRDDRSRSISH